jgi:hypothetical protein
MKSTLCQKYKIRHILSDLLKFSKLPTIIILSMNFVMKEPYNKKSKFKVNLQKKKQWYILNSYYQLSKCSLKII